MDCSMPAFPVIHCLPEFAQTHVHWVSNAIQPSHPLLSPSPMLCNKLTHVPGASRTNRCFPPHIVQHPAGWLWLYSMNLLHPEIKSEWIATIWDTFPSAVILKPSVKIRHFGLHSFSSVIPKMMSGGVNVCLLTERHCKPWGCSLHVYTYDSYERQRLTGAAHWGPETLEFCETIKLLCLKELKRSDKE